MAHMTRRDCLAALARAGGLLTVGGLLQACQPTAPASPTAAPAAPTAVPAKPTAAAPAPTAAATVAPAATVAAVPTGGNRPSLRVRAAGDGTTLDPAFFSLFFDYQVVNNVYSALLRYKPGTAELMPDLATNWEVSPDGRTYTFRLRQGVRWHKGFGEFTSADVKYSIERIMDPATKSIWAARYSGVERVATPDPYTVTVSLKEPDAYFLSKVSTYREGFIVNQKAVAQFGQDYARNPIGTGPFVFNRWTPKTEIVLDPNDEYYGGAPKVGQVTFKVLPEPATAQAAFEKGGVPRLLEKVNGSGSRSARC